ncbi:thioredoxin family protein, partial [Vibrio anguillarum]|nr:thioredoxin family protein [Vibrio anguillarum]
WIDDQTYYATRPVQPGVSLAMSAQELNEKILQDPEFLVRYLRAQGGL